MDEGHQKAHTTSNTSIVCIMEPAEEYWLDRTLFEISRGLSGI